jgi:hypothetical protein
MYRILAVFLTMTHRHSALRRHTLHDTPPCHNNGDMNRVTSDQTEHAGIRGESRTIIWWTARVGPLFAYVIG